MFEEYFEDINNVKEILLSVLSLILIVKILPKKRLKPIQGGYVKLISFMIFMIFLHSMFFSFSTEDSLKELYMAVLVLLNIYLLNKIYGRYNILKVYKKTIFSLAVFLLFTSNYLLLFNNSQSYYTDGNFHGITPNSNVLALYFVFIMPLVINKLYNSYQENKNTLLRAFIIFIIIDIFYIVYLTRSRTTLVILLCFSAISYFKYEKKLIKKILIVLISLLLGVLLSADFEIYLSKSNSPGDSLTATRENLWITRVNAIKEKPLIGWGFAVNEYAEVDKYHIYNKKEKGNTVLAVLEEFGMFFGIFFIYIFSIIFKKAIINYSKNKNEFYLQLTIIGVLLHSLLETWIFNFYSLLTFFFWLIIITSFQFQRKIIK